MQHITLLLLYKIDFADFWSVFWKVNIQVEGFTFKKKQVVKNCNMPKFYIT